MKTLSSFSSQVLLSIKGYMEAVCLSAFNLFLKFLYKVSTLSEVKFKIFLV